MKSIAGIFVFFAFMLNSSAQLIIDSGNRGGGSDSGAKIIEKEKKMVKAPVLNVLFVGDNYSMYNSLQLVVQYMGAQLKKPINIKTGTLLSQTAKFSDHLNNTATKEALDKYKWDYIIFQDQGDQALNDPDSTHRDGMALAKLAYANGAKPVFFMTWAGSLEQDKTMEIFKVYKKLAIESKGILAPVGSAWQRAYKAYPKLQFYQQDSTSPGAHGSYLAAAVLTSTITRSTVVGQKNTGLKSVTVPQALALQKIAVQTIIDYNKHLKKTQAAEAPKK